MQRHRGAIASRPAGHAEEPSVCTDVMIIQVMLPALEFNDGVDDVNVDD